MSDPNDPYEPPPPNIDYRRVADPFGQLRAAGRRASIMLASVAGLFLFGGLCLGFASTVSLDQFHFPADLMAKIQEYEKLTGSPFSRALFSMGIVGAVIGAGLLVVSVLVWRGNRAASMAGIVLCSCLILMLLVMIVASLAQGALSGAVIPIAMVVMLGLGVAWLVDFLKVSPQLEAARVRTKVKFTQHFQKQQAIEGAGYAAQVPSLREKGVACGPAKEPPPLPFVDADDELKRPGL